MSTFFPPGDVEQKSLPPTKAERITSQVFGTAVALTVAMQMIGVVHLHAVRDALAQYGFGAVGNVLDIGFELFHGFLSGPVPQVASWTETIPTSAMQNVYLGVLSLAAGSFITSFSLMVRREHKNFVRGMGDTRSW